MTTEKTLPNLKAATRVSRSGRHIRVDLREWAIIGLFSCLTVVMLYPLSVHLSSMVPEPTDPLLNSWRMQWHAHTVLGGPAGVAIRNVVGAATDVSDPTTLDERRAVAARLREAIDLGMPTLVDDLDDAVNIAYAGWPTRLYLIGADGRVAYRGGLGPFGFHPKELRKAIEAAVD